MMGEEKKLEMCGLCYYDSHIECIDYFAHVWFVEAIILGQYYKIFKTGYEEKAKAVYEKLIPVIEDIDKLLFDINNALLFAGVGQLFKVADVRSVDCVSFVVKAWFGQYYLTIWKNENRATIGPLLYHGVEEKINEANRLINDLIKEHKETVENLVYIINAPNRLVEKLRLEAKK